MSPQEQLENGLREMRLALPAAVHEKLLAYVALLYKWNKTYSLTALKEQDKAVSHHLLDSLSILPFVPDISLLDVGSGGGHNQGRTETEQQAESQRAQMQTAA